MTRDEYVKQQLSKHYPTQTAAAKDLGVEENTVRRYFNNLRKPGDAVCRAVQLLDFVRSLGLEPPEPIVFD